MGEIPQGKTLIIVALILLGVLGGSKYVACATALLLAIHLSGANAAFSFLEKNALDIGIVFLLLSVLAPIASGSVPFRSVTKSLFTTSGVCAVMGGALATLLNGKGVRLLQADQGVIVGLIVGNVIGILVLGGIPVGPVAAGGITAVLIGIAERLRR